MIGTKQSRCSMTRLSGLKLRRDIRTRFWLLHRRRLLTPPLQTLISNQTPPTPPPPIDEVHEDVVGPQIVGAGVEEDHSSRTPGRFTLVSRIPTLIGLFGHLRHAHTRPSRTNSSGAATISNSRPLRCNTPAFLRSLASLRLPLHRPDSPHQCTTLSVPLI